MGKERGRERGMMEGKWSVPLEEAAWQRVFQRSEGTWQAGRQSDHRR